MVSNTLSYFSSLKIVSNIPKDWIESDPITYKPPAFLATSIEPQLVEFCCFVREKLQADKQGLDVEQR